MLFPLCLHVYKDLKQYSQCTLTPFIHISFLHSFICHGRCFPFSLKQYFPCHTAYSGRNGVFSSCSSLQVSLCTFQFPLSCSNCDAGWAHPFPNLLSNDFFKLQCTFLWKRGLRSHTPTFTWKILDGYLYSIAVVILSEKKKLCTDLYLSLFGLVEMQINLSILLHFSATSYKNQ